MRLNHIPCPESLSTPITPESLPTSITQCQSPCVIKSIISGLHPMIILQNKFFVFKPKSFWMLHLNDHLYTKLMCLLWAVNFWCRTRLRMPKHFQGLSLLEICLTTNTWSFTRREIYPYLLLPDTSFPLPFHLTVQLY